MSGYTPSEEEMREYVANGGEYRPWETPDAAEEAARVAAFDRFLAEDRRKTAASLVADIRETLAGYFDFEKDPWEEYANPEPEDVWRLHCDLKAALERIEKGASDDQS